MWSSVIQGCELQKYVCVYNFRGKKGKEKTTFTAKEEINAVEQDLRAKLCENALSSGYEKEVGGEKETIRSYFNL